MAATRSSLPGLISAIAKVSSVSASCKPKSSLSAASPTSESQFHLPMLLPNDGLTAHRDGIEDTILAEESLTVCRSSILSGASEELVSDKYPGMWFHETS